VRTPRGSPGSCSPFRGRPHPPLRSRHRNSRPCHRGVMSRPVFQPRRPAPGDEHNAALLPCSRHSPPAGAALLLCSQRILSPLSPDPAFLLCSRRFLSPLLQTHPFSRPSPSPRIPARRCPSRRCHLGAIMEHWRKTVFVLPQVQPGCRELGSPCPASPARPRAGRSPSGCCCPAAMEHPCLGGPVPGLVPQGCSAGAAGCCPEPEPVPPLPLPRLEPSEPRLTGPASRC